MGLFIGGLKEEIRLEVQTLDTPTRYKAISMAWNVERKLIRAGILKALPGGKRQNYSPVISWQNKSVPTRIRSTSEPAIDPHRIFSL